MNNLVVNGEYKNSYLCLCKKTDQLTLENTNIVVKVLSKTTIKKYEVVHIERGKNIIDIMARIIIGIYFMGGLGIIAGFTASDAHEKYRLISIEFEDGKKSLVKLNQKYFNKLIQLVH